MNMIRLWGGGFYEHDAFYELCDEYGLMIWHDFMYACSTYPLHEPQFLANCGAEAAEHIRRVRHHPSIALWCGNNELEQGLVGPKWDNWQMSWEDYGKLFDDLLPRLIAELDGERAYWPCSPHTPLGERKDFNNPNSGDAHCWDVWFGWRPFEAQRNWQHRFMSEFGFQSFPEPRTVAAFIADTPADRNLTSYVMDFHQRSKQQGNRCIYAYLLDWFRQPQDFDHSLWMTQLTHALCIQVAAEHTRRMQPRMMGVVYWQLNDLWPAPTWASIDVFGRWKALQHLARRFFAPVLVHGIDDPAKGTVAIHLSNHLPTTERITVAWRFTDTAGKVLAKGGKAVEITAQSAQEVATVARTDLKKPPAAEDLLLWLEARRGNVVVSDNLCFFARPKHLSLAPKPGVRATVAAADDGSFRITLAARAPALWTRLELADADADWSDNWLHLDGANARVVTARPWRRMTLAQFRKQLRISSLVDHG
jgi:beta-mannosidase